MVVEMLNATRQKGTNSRRGASTFGINCTDFKCEPTHMTCTIIFPLP